MHLIEIDLLRGGERVGEELASLPTIDYILLVNRAGSNRYSDVWEVALNEPLPTIPVSLLYPDPDIPLNMMAVIDAIYQRYRYALIPNYDQAPPPPQ